MLYWHSAPPHSMASHSEEMAEATCGRAVNAAPQQLRVENAALLREQALQQALEVKKARRRTQQKSGWVATKPVGPLGSCGVLRAALGPL